MPASARLRPHSLLTKALLHIFRYTRLYGSSACAPVRGRTRLPRSVAGGCGHHHHSRREQRRSGPIPKSPGRSRTGGCRCARTARSLQARSRPHRRSAGAGAAQPAADHHSGVRRPLSAGDRQRLDHARNRTVRSDHPAPVRPRHRARDGTSQRCRRAAQDHGGGRLEAGASDRICGRAARARRRRPLERAVRRRQLGDLAQLDAARANLAVQAYLLGPPVQLLAVLGRHPAERRQRAAQVLAAEEGRARLRLPLRRRALCLGWQLRPAAAAVRPAGRRRL